MKQPTKEEQIFAQLRGLPPELSREQVEQIILILPTLPPPSGNWFFFNHLNSIIMTTTIVSSLAVLIFYIFHLNASITLVENTPIINAEEKVEIVTDASTISSLPEIEQKKFINENKVVQKEAISPNKTYISPKSTRPANFVMIDTIPKLKRPIVEPSPSLLNNHNSDLAFLENPTKSSIFDSTNEQLFPSPPRTIINPEWGEAVCTSTIDFDGNILIFKNRLLRHLEKDGLISSAKQSMICYFTPKIIVINQQQMPSALEKKYYDFMAEYNIFPCAQRIIETTKQYVAIGNMSKEGFKGMVKGTVDLDDLNKTAKSSLLREFESKNGMGMMEDGIKIEPAYCDQLIKIEQYELERLQEELKDMIRKSKADVKNLSFPVQIEMEGQHIKLNQQLLSESKSEEYFDLLRHYEILPCQQRVIAVDRKSIAVGDMLEKGFRGTVLGKKISLTSEHGRIDFRLGKGYKTMNVVDWGTNLELD